MKYLIDSNIFITLILHDFLDLTSYEKENNRLFEDIKSVDRIIPDFILTEFVTTIQKRLPYKYNFYKKPQHKLVNESTLILINNIHNLGLLYTPDETEINLSISLLNKTQEQDPYQQNVTLTDCLLLAIAKNKRYNILTNEKELTELLKRI